MNISGVNAIADPPSYHINSHHFSYRSESRCWPTFTAYLLLSLHIARETSQSSCILANQPSSHVISLHLTSFHFTFADFTVIGLYLNPLLATKHSLSFFHPHTTPQKALTRLFTAFLDSTSLGHSRNHSNFDSVQGFSLPTARLSF